jgi:hypothetical protein|tara:strand:+ start:6109 stop:8367 length:2259 start_codon:yes stop_codon:yes gene_type:complete
MVDYANQDKITSLSAASTDGITDGVDHLHSGIIKVLSKINKGNYIAEYGSSVFQQIAGSSRTKFKFNGDIKYVRDGRIYVGTPTEVELTSDPNASNDRYDLIVISGSALAVRTGNDNSTPVVPDLQNDDIPVALIKVVGGSSANATDRHIQLYGYDKTTFAQSIQKLYNNVGTESATLEANGDVSLTGSLIVGSNIIKASDSGSTITMDTNDNVTIGNNLTVGNDLTLGNNVIRASDGGTVITTDTSSNATIINNLTVGGDLLGPVNGTFNIASMQSMVFKVDTQNNRNDTWAFMNGAGATVVSIDEVGNVSMNHLDVKGGIIDSSVTGTITMQQHTVLSNGLTVTPSRPITNQGYRETVASKYMALTANSNSTSGTVIPDGNPNALPINSTDYVIRQNLMEAIQYPLDCLKEVYYLGTNEDDQVAMINTLSSGLYSGGSSDPLFEMNIGLTATNFQNNNGLYGSGGFVCLATDPLSGGVTDFENRKITLVNTSNTPVYIFTYLGIGEEGFNKMIAPLFGKGIFTQNRLSGLTAMNCVNLQSMLHTQILNTITQAPHSLTFYTGGGGSTLNVLDAYVLKPTESVTLQNFSVDTENPEDEMMHHHGFMSNQIISQFYNPPISGNSGPLHYWMPIANATNTITSKVLYNGVHDSIFPHVAQSGYTIHSAKVGGSSINLPPHAPQGTQYFVYAETATVVICANPSGGHSIETAGIASQDVFTNSTATTTGQSDTLAAGEMATYVKLAANKWLKVG